MKSRWKHLFVLITFALLLGIPSKVHALEWDSAQPEAHILGDNKIEITFAPSQSYDCYYDVYRKENNGAWEAVVQDLTDSVVIDCDDKTPGATYYYKVEKIQNAGSAVSNIISLKYIELEKMSLVNTSSGIKITWNIAKGATSYNIYRKSSDGSWKKLKSLKASKTTTSYTDKTASSGNFYNYKVVPYYNGNAGVSLTKNLYRVKSPSLSSVKSKKCKVTIKWKKVSKACRYQVYYKVSGCKAKYIYINKNKLSYTTPKLKKGKNCYIKVKAIIYDTTSFEETGSDEAYIIHYSTSTWSSTKKVKVK